MSHSVVLAAGKRTAFSDFGGSLKDTPLFLSDMGPALGSAEIIAT